MMLLVIMGYIAYDQLDVLGAIGYGLIAMAALGIVFFFIRQLKNMTIAKIISETKHKKFKVLKINWVLITVSNVVIIGLSLLHFYIWIQQGKNLEPLYNEYGIGVLLGIGMFILNSRDFTITTTDKGIAYGSKFDLKLLEWEAIQTVTQTEKGMTITPKNTIGFKSLAVPKDAISRELDNLLRMENLL
jgi:hypothetical protein